MTPIATCTKKIYDNNNKKKFYFAKFLFYIFTFLKYIIQINTKVMNK